MRTQLLKNERNACRGKNNGTTVRLPATLRLRVDALANRHGLKAADIVRNALWVQVPTWERDGVKLAITAA